MGKGFLLVAVLFGATMARAADLDFRYSRVYDEARACPGFEVRRTSSDIVGQMRLLQARWLAEGDDVVGRIRRITGGAFPPRPLVLYGIGCGPHNISDPLTLVVFNPDGTAIPLEDLWRSLVHELLHIAAGSSERIHAIQDALERKYPDEHADALRHIIVAGLEVRLFGHDATAPYYTHALSYARAYIIAVDEGLTEPRVP